MIPHPDDELAGARAESLALSEAAAASFLSTELIAQRAERMAQLKAAFLAVVQREHPTITDVEMHPDAAIDFFGVGLLDAPEPEWAEFLASFAEGTFAPVDEDDIPPEALDRMKSARIKRVQADD